MRIQLTKPLFAWDCLEDSPSLKTVRQFLQAIPDGILLEGLRNQRGRGRNDYPVHVLWGVVLLTHLLRHTSIDSCLAELCRNEGLRRLIGIESEEKVPKKWNVSRFIDVLGTEPHLARVQEIFDGELLGELLELLGSERTQGALGVRGALGELLGSERTQSLVISSTQPPTTSPATAHGGKT